LYIFFLLIGILLLFLCFFNSFYTVQAIPPYILGPGDVIDIYAVDSRREDILENPSDTNSLYQFYQKTQEATNAHQVEVDQEGKIYFPYVGFIEAKGKSLREFEIILQKKLSKFVDHPQVRIKIKTPKNISVYVFGDLDDPGVYQLTDVPGQTSIFNLLRVAKAYKSRSSTGANLESNVASSVSIARRKGPNKWEYVELAMNSLTPDMTDNDDLYLRDGDYCLYCIVQGPFLLGAAPGDAYYRVRQFGRA
jgi:protein involved in polysaccharide export with SLBB domain